MQNLLQSIPYSPSLIILNINQLPKGTGCKYLLTILRDSAVKGELRREYIAKAWKRKCPLAVALGETIIVF